MALAFALAFDVNVDGDADNDVDVDVDDGHHHKTMTRKTRTDDHNEDQDQDKNEDEDNNNNAWASRPLRVSRLLLISVSSGYHLSNFGARIKIETAQERMRARGGFHRDAGVTKGVVAFPIRAVQSNAEGFESHSEVSDPFRGIQHAI